MVAGCTSQLLTDEPGGYRELVFSVDDMFATLSPEEATLPREDVAEVLVQALLFDEFRCRSFDLTAKPKGVGAPPDDIKKCMLESLGEVSCTYTFGPDVKAWEPSEFECAGDFDGIDRTGRRMAEVKKARMAGVGSVEASTASASSAPPASPAEQRWLSDWRKRIDCWWFGLPQARITALQERMNAEAWL